MQDKNYHHRFCIIGKNLNDTIIKYQELEDTFKTIYEVSQLKIKKELKLFYSKKGNDRSLHIIDCNRIEDIDKSSLIEIDSSPNMFRHWVTITGKIMPNQ